MRIGFKRGGIAALAVVMSMGAATGARAQHVVTEAEAAKLTLEALTAPPPPPRPIYRVYVHRAMARSYVVRGRGFEWRAARWKRVAYRRAGDERAFHHSAASSNPNRHHRA